MVWFKSKAPQNDVDLSLCNPIIVNGTPHSIVVFLDRGVLYNKQVLAPGEAVGMTRKQTAGSVTPYKIHAVVGQEKSLPTRTQSMRNALSTMVIPTAFIVGTLMAASSAGTSSAVTRAAGSIVVRGMVIDSAALAAGSMTANRAAFIAEKLLEKLPDNFATKSGMLMPGQRFVVVKGGVEEKLTLHYPKEKTFRQVPINGDVKVPMDTLQDKMERYTPSFIKKSTKKLLKNSSSRESSSSKPAADEARQEVNEKALEAPPSAPTEEETEEDRQLRLAIEESLKMEEQRKEREKLEPVVTF